MDRVLDRLGTVEDQITVLTGIADGAVEGPEVRGMYRVLDHVEARTEFNSARPWIDSLATILA